MRSKTRGRRLQQVDRLGSVLRMPETDDLFGAATGLALLLRRARGAVVRDAAGTSARPWALRILKLFDSVRMTMGLGHDNCNDNYHHLVNNQRYTGQRWLAHRRIRGSNSRLWRTWTRSRSRLHMSPCICCHRMADLAWAHSPRAGDRAPTHIAIRTQTLWLGH